LSKEKTDEIIQFLSHFKKDYWIYPGVIKRKLLLNSNQVYHILNFMEKDGLLKTYYEQYCNQCQKSSGHVSVFNEIPDIFTCENCGAELSGIENSIIVYQVIKDV
jgi:Fe2+ or Zn2+ uptake regulation protein